MSVRSILVKIAPLAAIAPKFSLFNILNNVLIYMFNPEIVFRGNNSISKCPCAGWSDRCGSVIISLKQTKEVTHPMLEYQHAFCFYLRIKNQMSS